MSVIMPVRNGEAFVELAVRSILAQTFCNFELIVVDDGSSDNTQSILAGIAAGDSRVRLMSTGGRGIVEALNLGIRHSRSELIARMDADDIAFPDRLERQIQFMRSHAGIVASGSSAVVIDESGKETGTWAVSIDHDSLAAKLSHGNALIHPTMIMRKQSVVDAGLYRQASTYAEDYDLWLRLEETGGLANLAEPTLKYRMHGGQVSKTKRMQQRSAAALAIQVALRRRSGKGEGVDMTMPMLAVCADLLKLRADETSPISPEEGPELAIMLRLARSSLPGNVVRVLVSRLKTEANLRRIGSLRIKLALAALRDLFIRPARGQFGNN